MAPPTDEERLSITRESETTWFATNAAWPFHLPDVAPLWDGPEVEIVNRPIAGADEAPYPPASAPSRRALQCVVLGAFDLDGDPVDADGQRQQLQDNIAQLVNNVIARVLTGDGTVDVELFGAEGASVGVRPAQFVGPLRTTKDTPASAIVTLDLYFPAGVFDLVAGGS